MKILIIDDDIELSKGLRTSLQYESCTVDLAHDGEAGFKMAQHDYYDVIILDNNLPKNNGFTVCSQLRKNHIQTPILILSILNDTDTKINLLEIGADDYLTKPFSTRELLARLKVLIRRQNITNKPVIRLGPLVINSLKQTVYINRRPIDLPRKQYMLLEYLGNHYNEVVTRSTIMEKIWDMNAEIWSNTLEAHICELRKKIQPISGKKIIHTINGRGYKLTNLT